VRYNTSVCSTIYSIMFLPYLLLTPTNGDFRLNSLHSLLILSGRNMLKYVGVCNAKKPHVISIMIESHHEKAPLCAYTGECEMKDRALWAPNRIESTAQISPNVEGYVIHVTWRRARVVIFKKCWSIGFTSVPVILLVMYPSECL